MLKFLKIAGFLLVVVTLGYFYRIIHRQNIIPYMFIISEGKIFNGFSSLMLMNKNFNPIYIGSNNIEVSDENVLQNISPSEVLKEGDGIIFLETSDRLELSSLVLCAIESAARMYENRPVVFFLKGLNDTNIEEAVKTHFPVLSSLENIYIFPLKLEELFIDTPLLSWYNKTNPEKESHWLHVSADGCRLALIWKYGGMYMDTDIISIRPIPDQDFLAAQHSQFSSNGIFQFSAHHNFTQQCMEDFVKNYNSRIWGHQGPFLFTRILRKFCDLPDFNSTEDIMCGNITFFNPQRFYPIGYPSWRSYYRVWDKLPTFNDSYALHLWNYMNSKSNLTMVPGSNILVEHLYKQYCPSIYDSILRNMTTL